MNEVDVEALSKLEKWEKEYIYNSDNSVVKKCFDKAGEVLKPITDPLAKKIKIFTDNKVLSRIQEAIQFAIAGAFQFTQDNIKYTYNKEFILKKLKIESFDDLYKVNADEIEKHVRKIANQNKIAATLEGLGLGMGGLELTLIEIPIFLSLITRVQQQICACYGFYAESEFEQSFMLKALSFSDFVAVGGKSELILELNALKVAIRRHTYKELKEMGGKYVIPEIAKNFAKQQGKQLSKKKMTQALPLIGGTVGALFNYGYIHKVINVTNNLYKRRFLEDKKLMQTEMIIVSEDVIFEEA